MAPKKRNGLKSARLFALAALFLGGTSVRAQSYSLDWSTVDGGGGTSTGGVYSVSGSIGQPEAGPTMSGGNFSVDGGFWSVLGAVQTPGLPLLTIALTTTNTAVVSWPYPSPGFALQQNSALGTTDWMTVTNSAFNNGSLKWVIVSANAGNKFFRLGYP